MPASWMRDIHRWISDVNHFKLQHQKLQIDLNHRARVEHVAKTTIPDWAISGGSFKSVQDLNFVFEFNHGSYMIRTYWFTCTIGSNILNHFPPLFLKKTTWKLSDIVIRRPPPLSLISFLPGWENVGWNEIWRDRGTDTYCTLQMLVVQAWLREACTTEDRQQQIGRALNKKAYPHTGTVDSIKVWSYFTCIGTY